MKTDIIPDLVNKSNYSLSKKCIVITQTIYQIATHKNCLAHVLPTIKLKNKVELNS